MSWQSSKGVLPESLRVTQRLMAPLSAVGSVYYLFHSYKLKYIFIVSRTRPSMLLVNKTARLPNECSSRGSNTACSPVSHYPVLQARTWISVALSRRDIWSVPRLLLPFLRSSCSDPSISNSTSRRRDMVRICGPQLGMLFESLRGMNEFVLNSLYLPDIQFVALTMHTITPAYLGTFDMLLTSQICGKIHLNYASKCFEEKQLVNNDTISLRSCSRCCGCSWYQDRHPRSHSNHMRQELGSSLQPHPFFGPYRLHLVITSPEAVECRDIPCV